MVFFGWAALGLVVYATYGRKRSTLSPNYVEPPEAKLASDALSPFRREVMPASGVR